MSSNFQGKDPPPDAPVRRFKGVRILANGMLDATPTGRFVAIFERNATESPLLLLPAEIRNHIWSFVLTTEQVIISDGWSSTSTEYGLNSYVKDAPSLDLLYVCRPNYAETALLTFTLNCFSLTDIEICLIPDWLEEWTHQGQQHAILEVEMSCWNLVYSLSTLSGLKLVHLKHDSEPSPRPCLCKEFPERINEIYGDGKVEVRISSWD